MSDNYLQIADTVSAREGKAFATIDGLNRELFETSSLRAQLDLVVQARRMLGNRMTQHKVVGAEGTGSLTMYFANSQELKRAITYLKTGNYRGIKLRVVNEDQQSTIGKQEVVLNNVILKTIPVASLDDNSDDPVTFDSDFTFDSIEGLSYFDLPSNYR
jgi:hypothetical protein